jgi:hypothetical protein
MYDSADYANTRIRDTVVMLKRKPVLVRNVRHNMQVLVTPIISTHKDVYVKDLLVPMSELNLTNFSLGFINKGAHSPYLYRRALRHDWKQGLRVQNVKSTLGNIDMVDIGMALLHRYPSFDMAVSQVLGNVVFSRAWCADFCIKDGGIIAWRQYDVGKYNDNVIELVHDFKFLKDSLKECINESCRVF